MILKFSKIGILLLTFLITGSLAYADTVIIENNISNSASTGGNTASNGNVVEGKSRIDISVETTVNGEVVEKVEKHSDIEEEISETSIYHNDNVYIETNIKSNTAKPINNSEEIKETQAVKEIIDVNFSTTTKATSTTDGVVESNNEKRDNQTFLEIIRNILAYVFKIF